MSKEISQTEFDSMSWTELGELDCFLNKSNYAELQPETVQNLLQNYQNYDVPRKMMLIRWGIILHITGIEDIAVEFYEREDDHGAQYTILLWLEDAVHLTEDHIERVERAPTRLEPEDLEKRVERLRVQVSDV